MKVEMNIKKNKEKMKDRLAAQKRKYIFLTILMLLGIIIGGGFVFLLSKSDQQIIISSLKQFFKNVQTDQFDYFASFWQSLKNQVLPVLFIWLLGISIIGVPFILFYDFFKGFLVGFSISSIFITYKWKGVLKAFFYVFPHQILGLLFTIFLCFYALRFSGKLIAVFFFKKEIPLRLAMKRYIGVLGIVMVAFCFISLMEIFLAPVLLRLV